MLAERSGLRIAEVPVDWVDDPDSRVDIVATAMADLRGVARVGPGAGARRPAAARPARSSSAGDPIAVDGVPPPVPAGHALRGGRRR